MRYFMIMVVWGMITSAVFCQDTSVLSPPDGNQDGLNKTDAGGFKQGRWERKYPTGQVMYVAMFKDNKLVGEMKRFHPNGKPMAWIVYNEQETGQGVLYDEEGRKMAEGPYQGTLKQGEWLLYDVTGRLVGKENYVANQKAGVSQSYYRNGAVSSLSYWKAGKLDSLEVVYYPNGAERMRISYRDGILHGPYSVFYEDGRREIYGMNNNGSMDGIWFFFNATGAEDYRITYSNGVALDRGKIDKDQEQRFQEFERNKGRLKDPEQFMTDPDGYFRKN